MDYIHVCSLTKKTTLNPVVAADGFIYDRDAFNHYIFQAHSLGQAARSPKTGYPLSHPSYTPLQQPIFHALPVLLDGNDIKPFPIATVTVPKIYSGLIVGKGMGNLERYKRDFKVTIQKFHKIAVDYTYFLIIGQQAYIVRDQMYESFRPFMMKRDAKLAKLAETDPDHEALKNPHGVGSTKFLYFK